MKLNSASIALIKENEGLRLTAYYDTVGVLTIGYGSARTFRGRPIYEGMTITEEEAELALQEDIERYQTFLTFFTRDFNANQIGALTSFEYNLGGGIWVNDGWNPNYSDADIIASMSNYRRPPEISARRQREIDFYQTTPTEGEGSDYGGATPNPDPAPSEPEDPNKSDVVSSISEAMQEFFDKIVEFLEDFLKYDVHTLTEQFYFSNKWVKVQRTYNNTYRVTLLPDLINTLSDGLNTENTGEKKPNPVPEPNPPEVPSQPPAESELLNKLYEWANARQGQSFDFDNVYGAQCVDLITWLNREFSMGLNLAGGYAKDIYQNAVPDTWQKIAGNPNNDAESAQIWNTLPNGAIVWFTNSWAGHVGLKAGDWAWTLNQNVDDPAGNGGPIRKSQLSTWIEGGGAGFLGAWVPK